MNLKAIIFGSTGMIGRAVLLECLDDDRVESILLINRRPAGITHNKIKEIIHNDFLDFSSLVKEFSGYNTCFFCLGISSVGLNETLYYQTTYEITMKAADALIQAGQEITFCYVSGAGTDSSEKGKIMWARVKGKVENTLLSMPFKSAYMFRPGFVQPMKGLKSRTKGYNVFYILFKPLYYVLKPFKGAVTDTSILGKAMIQVALYGYGSDILNNTDINKMAAPDNSHDD
jgi:uncharacterized protein YbjT (DUF2867 family)